MQESSERIRTNTIAYNLPSTSQRTETSAESVLTMGSGGATNGAPVDRTFSLNSSAESSKKTLPANGKKTKGRVKIKMEFIDNKLRRYTTFSKRKTGIMKKAYELSTLTGTQVMLLVASETGHVYTFATRKLQPMITSEAGKALIQTCLNSPDPPAGLGSSGLDQRMSATGFEETDLTYTVGDECEKLMDGRNYSSSPSSPNSDNNSPPHHMRSPSPQIMHLAVDNKIDMSGHRQQATTSSSLILTAAAAAGGALPPALHIGAFHNNPESSLPSSMPNDSTSSVFRLPGQGAGQPFALTISGTPKTASSSSNSQTSAAGAISVVQNSQQNLSLLSGNVMIPANQSLLQPSSSAIGGSNVTGTLMYHTTQGLMYATPTTIPESVILNLGQDQGQQYISIPVSLSLTQPQQQLMQPVTTTCQITGCSPAKKEKYKK